MTTDTDFILELATSSASLDRSPKKNWVENAGGLPPYVRKLARAIAKRGHSLSSAIAIAISRVKKWAAGGGDVDADTRAKAAKAVAQWEAAKAKNKSRVKLSAEEGGDYILLAGESFNIDIVRSAWTARESARRKAHDASDPAAVVRGGMVESNYPYRWIRELGNDYIIIEQESPDGPVFFRVEYEVENGEVEFDDEVRIKQVWIEDDESDELTLSESRGLADVLLPVTPTDRIVRLSNGIH